MDTSERLAAYAAGELDGPERTSLEAELARDARLRAELAAIRKVDRLLASLEPVSPPEQFRVALRARLVDELASGAAVASLAAARERRDRWRKPLTMVAAAAAITGVVGIGLQTLSGGDAPEGLTTLSTTGGAELSAPAQVGDSAEITSSLASPTAAPVYAFGGRYDKTTLNGIGARDDVAAALHEAALDPLGTQDAYLQQLTAAAAGRDAADPQRSTPNGETSTTQGAEGDGDSGELLGRCIPTILDDDRVPLFADLGSFEDQRALVVVLGARAADGDFDRLEFWVLSPDDCRVLFFAQDG